jgi:hypothetical protein
MVGCTVCTPLNDPSLTSSFAHPSTFRPLTPPPPHTHTHTRHIHTHHRRPTCTLGQWQTFWQRRRKRLTRTQRPGWQLSTTKPRIVPPWHGIWQREVPRNDWQCCGWLGRWLPEPKHSFSHHLQQCNTGCSVGMDARWTAPRCMPLQSVQPSGW